MLKFLKNEKTLRSLKQFFVLRVFFWTRRLEFWQSCGKICTRKSKFFSKVWLFEVRNREEIEFLQKKMIASRRSSGHLECTFNNPAQKISPEIQSFSAERPKRFKKVFFPHKIFLIVMFFWTHRMPLSEPCRKFFPEVPFFLAWSPQLRRKWKSPEKNASWLFSRRLEIIYISPTANVFPKAHKSFA